MVNLEHFDAKISFVLEKKAHLRKTPLKCALTTLKVEFDENFRTKKQKESTALAKRKCKERRMCHGKNWKHAWLVTVSRP